MSYKNLSTKKRYVLFFIILFCISGVGCVLLRYWNQTPETHFLDAMWLLEENQPERALKQFILAQKSKDPLTKKLSSLYLGHLYHHGPNGIPINVEKAVFYYEQAAELGSLEAMYTLALLYDIGDKIPENKEKAKIYMTQAAQELPEAQYSMAVWIERGYFGKPNTRRAVRLYEKAANAGIQNAVKSLISIYHGGFGGFPKNVEKEQYWRAKLK